MGRTLVALVAFALLGCSGAGSRGHAPTAAAGADPGRAGAPARPAPRAAPEPPLVDRPLFREARTGWGAVPEQHRARAAAFAGEYAAYLAAAKTPRRAVAGLVSLIAARGERLAATAHARPGARYWFVGPGGESAAFVLVGERPIEDGLRIVVASVDAPRIELKQSPVYGKAGLAMLDTTLYGGVALEPWLARPLALFVYLDRPGVAGGPIDVAIGEQPDDPVFVIPDLLPHLSRRVRRREPGDHAERMDAVAARSREALIEYLAARGIDERALAAAEASLVPAGPPVFIGVDRALLAGYGHQGRAMAYAAVRALADADASHHSAIVIAIARGRGEARASGLAFVRTAISRAIAALAAGGEALDVLDTARIHARSAALASTGALGAGRALAGGLVLDPRADDAQPAATRRVLDTLDAAGASYQLVVEGSWSSPSPELATLGIDAVDIAIPVSGVGAPSELLSTLDLYHAWLGAREWLTGE